MIISASRRTDIPSYYSDWFFHRIKEGYVYVRNPRNPHWISQVSLLPDVVDGIVFWTKNPAPMLDRLDELQDYPYYFHFTLNPYGTDIEKNVPSKKDVLIPTFRTLSSAIGKERVVWRYDPILLSGKYTLQYHMKYFRMLCDRLSDYTEKCTVSFIDLYPNIQRKLSSFGITALSYEQIEELMGSFSEIAKEHGIYMDSCCEEIDLSKFGIAHAGCIDRRRLERIGNYQLDICRDKNQRAACGCVSSIDIGMYNTCYNGCNYCYANFNQRSVLAAESLHRVESPLLYGEVSPKDTINIREMRSCKNSQLNLLEEP